MAETNTRVVLEDVEAVKPIWSNLIHCFRMQLAVESMIAEGGTPHRTRTIRRFVSRRPGDRPAL